MSSIGSLLLWKWLALLLFACVPINGQRLFFSEYRHNTTDQALEIFNPFCGTVPLLGWELKVAQGSGAWATEYTFTATQNISQLETFVICNVGLYVRNTTNCSMFINDTAKIAFTGSDSLGLFHHDVLVDVIGEASTYKNAPWTIAGVENATVMHTMIRKRRVTEGLARWDFNYPHGRSQRNNYTSEWEVHTLRLDTLGKHDHDMTCSELSTFRKLTCGARGDDGLLTNQSLVYQIDCPIDCVTQTGQITGGKDGGLYHDSSTICHAALHSGAVELDASVPSGLTAAEITELCTQGAYAIVSPYTSTTLPQRNRGRPYFRYQIENNINSYQGSTNNVCMTSDSGSKSTGNAFNISLLEVTECPGNCSSSSQQGFCNRHTGTCMCASGFYGDDCASITCPQCFNNGTCDSTTGRCTCTGIFTGDQCLQRSCTNDCNGRGVCDTSSGICDCVEPYFGVECLQYRCPNSCTGRGFCDTNNGTCVCSDGYTGRDCSLKKCPEDCNGHGTCDFNTGTCTCFPDSRAINPGGSCRTGYCLNNCSNRGVCNYLTRQCTCFPPYVGADCSISP